MENNNFIKNFKINKEFEDAFDIIENSNNSLIIFGQAGTGKSTFLNLLKERCKKRYAFLSPTGIAAIKIKGKTIHSFFSLPLTLISKDRLQPLMSERQYNNIYNTDTIIIDEISMVNSWQMDCISERCKYVMNSDKPFGGKQVIMVGDFYQLPPVIKSNDKLFYDRFYPNGCYFFQNEEIKKMLDEDKIKKIVFNEVFRQKDENYLSNLAVIRKNDINDYDKVLKSMEYFNIRADKESSINKDLSPIILSSLKEEANLINNINYSKLMTEEKIYQGVISGKFSESQAEELAIIRMRLKIGTKIMFTVNEYSSNGSRFKNGDIGEITKLEEDYIIVRLRDNEIKIEPYTWDIIEREWNKFLDEFEEKVIGTYTQFPITYGWAITIHKSQGMSADAVIINNESIFANGQLYVALSRCTSIDNMLLFKKINPWDIKTDKVINEFVDKYFSKGEVKNG